MQFNKLSLTIIIYFTYFFSYAQSPGNNHDYHYPVDFTIRLSGNFGELRSGHFHSGIDIKTGGVTGKKIYAIEDGYVSRIKVSSGGYGKTLYIDHPNGYTSVYAHLDDFKGKIADFVKAYQYKNKSFEIEYFPEKNEFPVRRGETIAFSGNSGSSSGPHLHFELRKTRGQKPVNPLMYNFEIEDNISPVIKSLFIYPIHDEYIHNHQMKKSYRIHKEKGKKSVYSLKENDTIVVNGIVGFGLETYDLLNKSHNKCGVYSVELLIDSATIYKSNFSEFSFYETRYINSHIDYYERLTNKKLVHKLFVEPNNILSIYDQVVDNGTFSPKNKFHDVTIIVKDVFNNISLLKFTLKNDPDKFKKSVQDADSSFLFSWMKENEFSNDSIEIHVPEKSLYHNINFHYEKESGNEYSPVHAVHYDYIPVHKRYSIALKYRTIDSHLKDKAYIAYLDDDEWLYEGGEIINGKIVTETRNFGKFCVMLDTIPPSIQKKKYNKLRLDYMIKDGETGIKSVNGYINGEWALFEYDPKNDLLFYEIDAKKTETGKEHSVEIFITDNRDNVQTFYDTAYW